MLFLAGAAAGTAVDLISSLKQLGSPQGGVHAGFEVSAQAEAGTPAPAAAPPPPMTPGTMMALLHAQAQGSSKDLMSLLDLDGNGGVSKSEFEQALGQNGHLAQANGVFAKLDADKNGSIDASEMTAALRKGGHRHQHGPDEAGAGGGAGANAAKKGASSQKSVNPDGSVTTTITYADGSKVSMTSPAGGSGASANNLLEKLIQKQAQMLAATGAGRSLALSA